MHGDFTLDPLQYREDVSRVLAQQGRVQLDSDANEQTETLLRFLRGLARDLIGPHGGVGNSFKIDRVAGPPPKLQIVPGEYYVDGIRCVLGPTREPWDTAPPQPVRLDGPTKHYVPPSDEDDGEPLLFYLDVYERHISSSEDDSLREVALLGADTSSRAVITWQVRTLVIGEDIDDVNENPDLDVWYAPLNMRLRTNVRMRASANRSESTNPCIIAPDARYRGNENRLFRVEIHDGGKGQEKPTFKWSQDNGSIVYPIRKVNGAILHLGSLGRDARTQICVNDWVEVVDDDVVLTPQANPLLQVIDVRPAEMTIELGGPLPGAIGTNPKKHRIVRRWASDLARIDALTQSFDLADGVEINFSSMGPPRGGFRPGDYWLIPTRTAEGQVLWPRDENGDPLDLPPHGIEHHYAPLAVWRDRVGGAAGVITDVRRWFAHLGKKPPVTVK